MKIYLEANDIYHAVGNYYSEKINEGHKIFANEQISLISINENNEGLLFEFKAELQDFVGNVFIRFDESGMLEGYKCDCRQFSIKRCACNHIVGALYFILHMLQQQADKARREKEINNLLTSFEKDALAEIKSEIQNIQIVLTPYFCVIEELAGVSLTIGRIDSKKHYVVKNIRDFILAVHSNGTINYGKNFSHTHSKSDFSENQKKLFELIEKEMENYSDYHNILNYNFTYLRNFPVLKELIFSKNGLDDFFDLFCNKTINAKIEQNNKAELTLVSEEMPDIKFKAKKTSDGILISEIKKPDYMFMGFRWAYIIQNNRLIRVPLEYANLILKLYETAKSGEILFPEADLGRIATFFLPKLRQYGLIDEISLPEQFRENELEKTIYADSHDGAIFIKLIFKYGQNEINALDKTPLNFVRNIIEEYRITSFIKQIGFFESEEQYVLSDNDKIYDFYKNPALIEYLKQNTEFYATDAFLNKVRPATAVRFGLKISGGLLDVSIDADYPTAELVAILESYKEKKKYHLLKDGTFLNFNEEEEQFSAAAEMISGLGLTDKEIKNGTALLPKYRALYAERVLEEKKAIQAKTDKSFRKLNSDFTNYRDASFNVPPTLENVLRDYQKEGFEWLKILDAYGFGGILADDMGLGKTIQIISVILYEKLNAEVYKPSIIVAPTSLVYNWEREFAKFAPDVITSAVAGDASSRKETLQTESPDVYITTYDSLKRDLELYENMDFKFIVADEAQKIKNASTKNAQAVKALQGETRFALTGTPIENSLSELWSIFDFVMSGYLFSPSKFTKMYETPIIKNNDAQKAAELKKQIAPFVLRRLKKDVLQELPDKIETTVYAEMTTEQRKVYSAYLMQAKGELKKFINSEKSISSDKLKVLQMLTRLRQICCHPSTFIEDYFGGSGKLTATVESLEDFLEGGHRILVFSQFTKMLDIIKEELNLKNIDYFYLDGSTSAKERLHMAERFNAGLCGVFLISLKAGGTGLNLTGADVVIHYDPWWNPAVMEQASDRAHRIGQKNIVQVVNIIAKQSVEEKIIELQGKKKNLADNVIEGETAFINKMTDEELLELFNE